MSSERARVQDRVAKRVYIRHESPRSSFFLSTTGKSTSKQSTYQTTIAQASSNPSSSTSKLEIMLFGTKFLAIVAAFSSVTLAAVSYSSPFRLLPNPSKHPYLPIPTFQLQRHPPLTLNSHPPTLSPPPLSPATAPATRSAPPKQ